MAKTIYQAAAYARESVRMVQVAPKSHQIQEYSEKRRAWVAGAAMDYNRARAALTEARHAAALIYLGWDRMDAYGESCDKCGRLEDRIRESLESI